MTARGGFLTIPAPHITGVSWQSLWRLAITDPIARNEKQLGAIECRARKQTGLTQSALGSKIHLPQGTASRLEAGEPALQLRTLMAALCVLGLELIARPRSKGSESDIEELF
nr:helix-turn-helix domain-containing protein [Mesorhizobium sp. L48C026A00]